VSGKDWQLSDAAWIVLVLVMSFIILGGVGWTFAREMFIWRSTNDQHDLLQQFNDTIKEQTRCMKEQFDDAERRIDRFEGLSAGQKQELVNLIVATEQRIIGSLRDMLMRSQGMNVNFNHDANGTQIGNHNKQQG
jgi:hypothetical protein